MASKVEIVIDRSETVHTLPGIWEVQHLRRLLELAEFDDLDGLADSDMFDVALMVLQDLGHQQAGEIVLSCVFGSDMRPGLRQNLVDDLQDEEPWQDFSNIRQQQGIFVTVVLMHEAFPNRYPNPDARLIEVSLSVSPATMTSVELLQRLSAGMAETDVLLRLYESELRSGQFPDADYILWHRDNLDGNRVKLISSRQWLGSLTRGDRFQG